MAYNSINTKTASVIIQQIKWWRNTHSLLKADNTRWYIGITNNVDKRKKAHESKAKKDGFYVSYFNYWNAKTKNIARSIETYWHDLDMLETDLEGNTKENSIFVYVYKKYPVFRQE